MTNRKLHELIAADLATALGSGSAATEVINVRKWNRPQERVRRGVPKQRNGLLMARAYHGDRRNGR
jgi:hypothetical protein